MNEVSMRIDFERWIKPLGYSIEATATAQGIVYTSVITSVAWRAWKAASTSDTATKQSNRRS
jgi:hypothetical protein